MSSKTSASDKAVIVKFADLNPKLRETIKSDLGFLTSYFVPFEPRGRGIRELRQLRGITEIGVLVNAGSLTSKTLRNNQTVLSEVVLPLALYARQITVSTIQKKHNELVELMNKHGLLNTTAEGNYPRDWMNPSIIAKTHPIFYVKANGDLVFIKEGNNVSFRIEYARYLYQKAWAGKLGLNPWRWRTFLRPPKAPEKVRNWAKLQVQNLVLGLKSLKPAPQLVPVPIKASFANKRVFPRKR